MTCRLAVLMLGVHPRHMHELQLGAPVVVQGAGGVPVEVTLADANHCPGAVQLLFRVPRVPAGLPPPANGGAPAGPDAGPVSGQTTRAARAAARSAPAGAMATLGAAPAGARDDAAAATYVHTGDFRFHPRMLRCEQLRAFGNPTALFLDTTYGNPKHAFPPQVCVGCAL